MATKTPVGMMIFHGVLVLPSGPIPVFGSLVGIVGAGVEVVTDVTV